MSEITNIQPISTTQSAVSAINQIEGRVFDKDGVTNYGVVAEELAVTFPEFVDLSNPSNPVVKYNGIIAYLVNAIHELNGRVQNLEDSN